MVNTVCIRNDTKRNAVQLNSLERKTEPNIRLLIDRVASQQRRSCCCCCHYFDFCVYQTEIIEGSTHMEALERRQLRTLVQYENNAPLSYHWRPPHPLKLCCYYKSIFKIYSYLFAYIYTISVFFY